MAEGHNIIEHEAIPYEDALKFVKEDVTMQAIMNVFSDKVTEKLNDKLYTWEENQIRLTRIEYWMVRVVITVNKTKITIYLVPIVVAILLTDYLARLLQKI